MKVKGNKKEVKKIEIKGLKPILSTKIGKGPLIEQEIGSKCSESDKSTVSVELYDEKDFKNRKIVLSQKKSGKEEEVYTDIE